MENKSSEDKVVLEGTPKDIMDLLKGESVLTAKAYLKTVFNIIDKYSTVN